VAHEINNPLGVILCYTDILKEDGEASAEQRYADVTIIEKHALSCQRIVTDLLNFSSSHQMIKRQAAINPIIEDVVSMVNTQFRKKKITLQMDLAPNLPRLLLDKGRMGQVLLNLLMNALYASRENGTVRIVSRLMETERQVEVEVLDNGQGIDPQVLPKIFDPFFTTKPQGTGTGLGLSVSYGIIRDHNGDIRVESKPGAWTRFIIVLPQMAINSALVIENEQRTHDA